MDTQTVNMTFKNMSKNFGEFIVTLVTLFLMAFIIKLAVSSKTGIKRLDDKVKATTEAVGDFAKNIPIIPIGSNGGGISYGNVMGDGGNTSLINRLENNGILTRLEETNRENMNEFFGIKTNEP
ncbi:MAG: hypothetical protein LBO09_06930 [Candidatus Peribacteria bacterium]|jgi:hypothetical protein|nr:hypothetical protein [Candidatus Peribacteria bacterium]